MKQVFLQTELVHSVLWKEEEGRRPWKRAWKQEGALSVIGAR